MNLLGKWKETEYGGGQSIPVGGLAYYITAPSRYEKFFFNFTNFLMVGFLFSFAPSLFYYL